MAHQSRGAEVPLADETLLRRALMLPFMFAGLTLAAHIVENAMLNGETIRLDGAIRMQPR